jgi:hypothetical protein
MHRFHSFPADQNLGYVELAPDAIRSSFATDTPSQKMPTDLFIIGEKIDGRTNWLFCLAGDVDADNTRVSLEFLTKDINGERFRRILNYVELELRKGRKTVADWWDA